MGRYVDIGTERECRALMALGFGFDSGVDDKSSKYLVQCMARASFLVFLLFGSWVRRGHFGIFRP